MEYVLYAVGALAIGAVLLIAIAFLLPYDDSMDHYDDE